MKLVPLRCYRFTKPIDNEELATVLEKVLPSGVVRLNTCSQEFLWVQQQTVRLLLLRQDDFFGWVPVECESELYCLRQEWWQPMRLRGFAPLQL